MLTQIKAQPAGFVGLVIVGLFLFAAIFADWIMPFDPLKIAPAARMQPPSWTHLAGTDQLGRDVFSRIVMGSRIALLVSAAAIGLSLAIGIMLGLIAGYGPRWIDNLLLLLFDSVYSFPTVMLGLAAVTLFGPSMVLVVVVIVATQAPSYARIVRTQTLALRGAEFIAAERSLGAGHLRILLRHVLPNVLGPLLILASMDIPVIITLEAGLSFLGLGARPPTPSWGRLLNEGYAFIRQAPWVVVGGGIPLILVTLGFTFLGEALRDRLDPKLRRDF